MEIIISMVLYNNTFHEIEPILKELNKVRLKKRICIVDNSQNSLNESLLSKFAIEYIKTGKNLGFGKGHNIVFRKYIEKSEIFLILNPDIFIEAKHIEKAYNFMINNKEIGILAPKVLHNTEEYHLSSTCHLIPTPFNLFSKRFFPNFFKKSIDFYNLEAMKKEQIQFVPNLSGCCLFISSNAFKKVGYFDERFFLYMEDVDFVRRVAKYFYTIYFPEIEALHKRASLSYRKIKYLLIHLISAIKYFNKWGWFFDRERDKINKKTLSLLNNFNYKVKEEFNEEKFD